ncbi:MAG: glucose 1-dehydrogenase [Actinobacteria bacterium]|nr:glucose 1-dehydrogenase [Actinomycetota bacterium]
MDLKGKVAIITGGGTGVGRACALALATRGVHVAVLYSRSADEAAATVRDVEATGVDAIAVQADVAVDTAVSAAVDQAAATFGRLDVLVNSAGTTSFIPHADLAAMTEAQWDRILAVNLKGAFFAARACVPHMRQAGGGAIVNISSVAGATGGGSSIAYAASKGALNTLTKSLARALAPEIRVNAVAPGIIITRWVDGKEQFVESAIKRTPLQRPSYPEDVALATLYLIESRQMTGQIVVVDGGLTLV